MELQAQQMGHVISRRQRTRVYEKLSLENYIRYIETGKNYDLTCELLKQVIHMHGFTKGKKPKNVVIDALKLIQLMDTARSTLNDPNISSFAFISQEEVIKDLGLLTWQECCITSVQFVNSAACNTIATNDDSSATMTKVCAMGGLVAKKKGKRTKRLAAITAGADVEEGGLQSAESACCSAAGGGRKRRGKRTLARFVGSDDSHVATLW